MESQNNADQVNRNAAASPASLGTMLREARERLGLRVEDVAVQIKFAPRQIEALEADDYKHLPEPAFLRGFVRSYAKILNLDSKPLLAALPQEKTSTPELIPASVNVPYPVDNTSQRQNLVMLGAALLLAVIAVGFSVWHFTTPLRQSSGAKPEPQGSLPVQKEVIPELLDQKREVTAPSGPVETRKRSSIAVEQPPSVHPAKTEAAVTAAHSSVRAARTKALSAAQSAVPAVQSPDATAETKAVHAEPQTQATDSGMDEGPTTMLRLVFDEESWTEITDKDGKMISSQINPRGSELNVRGRLPLSLVIGHAATTHLYQDGEPVDLTPYINSSSEVARITVK